MHTVPMGSCHSVEHLFNAKCLDLQQKKIVMTNNKAIQKLQQELEGYEVSNGALNPLKLHLFSGFGNKGVLYCKDILAPE